MEKSELVLSLIAIEPDLFRLSSRLTPADFSIVAELTIDGEPRVRANALTLQSLINEEGFITSFQNAYRDTSKIVRLQALASISNVSPATAKVLTGPILELLSDPEIGVRKLAIKAALRADDEKTISMLEDVANRDKVPFVRELAKEALSKLK